MCEATLPDKLNTCYARFWFPKQKLSSNVYTASRGLDTVTNHVSMLEKSCWEGI